MTSGLSLGTIVGVTPLDANDTTYHTFTADTTETTSYAIGDTPTSFGTMDSCSFTLVSRLQNAPPGSGADTYTLGVRIVNGATILAAGSAAGAFQSVATVTSTTEQTNGPTTFTYVNTAANKATWDGASVELQQTYSRSKGADGNSIQVDYFALTGTFTDVDLAPTPGVADVIINGAAPTLSLIKIVNHYWAVYTDGNGASATDTNVKNGTGTGYVTGDSGAYRQDVTATWSISGLSPSTAYDLEYLAEYDKSTDSTRAATVDFTTIADAGTVTPGVGAISLVGYQSTLQRTIAVGAATVTVQGQAADTQQTKAAGVADVVLNGYAVTLYTDYAIQSGVGTVTITGYQPALQKTATPGVAGIALNGNAITLFTILDVGASVGSITIQGYQATVQSGVSTSVPVGSASVALDGQLTTLLVDRDIGAGAGSVVVTGYPVTLQVSVAANTAAVTIQGYEPSVSATAAGVILAGAGSVLLTGQQVTIFATGGDTVVQPGAGLVLVSGYQPAIAKPKNYGGAIFWDFFFGEPLPKSVGGHGGAQALIQRRLDEDEELLLMIHEFMKKVA